MKKLVSLLNIVLVLGLILTPCASPTRVGAQCPEGATDDGSGGSGMPFSPEGGVPTSGEQVITTQELPPYMELLFMSDSAWDWNVHQWKDGKTTRLTLDPDTDWTPRASPGGGRLAFVSLRDGNAEIYVMDFDGTNEQRLTNNAYEDWYPSWSPSGHRLVFSSDRDGDDHEIYVMDVEGSHVTRLTYNDCWDSGPAYSPDGKKIAFASDCSGNDDIWIMNTDGTGLKNLTDNPASDWYPAWSPDGNQIAFTSYRAGNGEIWVQAVDGGLPVNLTNNLADDWASAWSPDGRWLAFSSNRDGGDQEIYIKPIPGAPGGGDEINISNNLAANDRYPDFFWPSISAKDGDWEQASTWLPSRVPGEHDRVLIVDEVRIASSTQKAVMQLEMDEIPDRGGVGPQQMNIVGLLMGTCDVRIAAPKGIGVRAPLGRVLAGQHSYLKKGCRVFLDAWPNGTITVNGSVAGGSGASAALDMDGGSVDLLAKNVVINGSVSGGPGGTLDGGTFYGLTWKQGGRGGDVTVGGEDITIGLTGVVQGGKGGDTNQRWTDSTCRRYPQDGGDGGSVFLGSGALASYGGTRVLTVGGKVYGGNGGDVQGAHSGRGGRGGDVKLNVQWGVWGVLNIVPMGQVSGGNGGGRPISPSTGEPVTLGYPVWGGNGGDVITLVSFSTTVAGRLNRPFNPADPRGAGGRGEEASCCDPDVVFCGADGFEGDVTTHPPSITFADTARVGGKNVWIYGGESWGIDFSQVEPGAISATHSITVAVGGDGEIDMRGHGSGENVLAAGDSVFLYANSDRIQLDPGISEEDVTDPPAQVAPAKVIYRGLLHANGDTTVLVDTIATITLTLTNAGGGADTFQFTAADTSGWSWELVPESLSLDSMVEGVVVATAFVPPEAAGLPNEVTFEAHSTADPSQISVADFSLRVVEISQIYLPLVLQHTMFTSVE